VWLRLYDGDAGGEVAGGGLGVGGGARGEQAASGQRADDGTCEHFSPGLFDPPAGEQGGKPGVFLLVCVHINLISLSEGSGLPDGGEVGTEGRAVKGRGRGGRDARPPGFKPIYLGDVVEPEERQRQRLAPRKVRGQAEKMRQLTLQHNQEGEAALAVSFFLASFCP